MTGATVVTTGRYVAIEAAITRLVQIAPAPDDATAHALVDALRADASPLALAIARVVELVGEGLVDPGVALPALASACATLAAAARGDLGEREREAARYEIETLLPVPEPRPRIAAPDVPAAALTRARRPRT